MDEMIDKPDLRVIERGPGKSIMIEGELTEANAKEFEQRMSMLFADSDSEVTLSNREVTLELYGLDIDDGIALATAINSLRQLRARAARIILKGAPQMLCHNLYRVGLLDDGGAIELVDMRLDEPSGV